MKINNSKIRLILPSFIALIIVAAIILVIIFTGQSKGLNTYARVAPDPVSLPSSDVPVNNEPDRMENGMLLKYADYYNQNNDFMGYLRIEGTYIDHPVLQCGDNAYYLERDINKNYYDLGSAFLDYKANVSKDHLPSNLTIYGHMAKERGMFGDLKNYRDFSYYQEHPIIEFDTAYHEGTWKIFSIYIINTEEKDGELFNYINFVEAQNESHFNYFVEEVTRRSRIITDVDVEYGDNLLTLSTCTYEIDNARLVIVARKVRNGEDASVDVNKAAENASTLYPAAWYPIHGGSMPQFPKNTWTDNDGKIHDNVD